MNRLIPSALLLLALSAPARAQVEADVRAAFATSYEQEQLQDYAAAAEALRAVYRADDYPINLRLGWLYYLRGDHTNALTHYRRAVALEPASVEARLGLAYPAAALDNRAELRRVYGEILELQPYHATALYRLGYLDYEDGDFQQAARRLEPLVERWPFDYDGVVLLGWTRLKLGDTPAARALFRRALRYNPQGASALEGLELVE